VNDVVLLIVVYVDDMIITGNNGDSIFGLNLKLKDTFEMINLGLLHFFLCIQLMQLDDAIFISQPKYALDLLKKIKMEDCKPCSTSFQYGVKLTKDCDPPKVNVIVYKQLVGSVIYLT
jgi:hypothetical protein